jgi:hypothetical protein
MQKRKSCENAYIFQYDIDTDISSQLLLDRPEISNLPIPMIPTIYSEGKRPLIPIDSGHRFRLKAGEATEPTCLPVK